MKYNIGTIITGTISGIKQYGVFIKFEDVFGFCHISNCSYKFIKNLNELYNIGDEVNAKVIEIDSVNNRINVSIKECENQCTQIKQNKMVYKSVAKNQKREFKNLNSFETTVNDNVKPSFDDMLKTYLKNSEERLNNINKRNQKYKKR